MQFPDTFLTVAKFKAYQKKFFQEVIKSPCSFSLIYSVYATAGNDSFLRAFTKSFSGTDYTESTIKCLHNLQDNSVFSNAQGIGDDREIIVYISPLQFDFFKENTGTIKTFLKSNPYAMDYKESFFRIVINGSTYQVTNIKYEGRVFNSSLAISITAKLLNRS
jgi:hypothetical protein